MFALNERTRAREHGTCSQHVSRNGSKNGSRSHRLCVYVSFVVSVAVLCIREQRDSPLMDLDRAVSDHPAY